MTTVEFENKLSGIRRKLLSEANRFLKRNAIAEEADDIVQEAIIELWKLNESGYQIRNAEALAMKITRTICVRHYRKHKIRTTKLDRMEFQGGSEASVRIDLQDAILIRDSLWTRLSETQKKYLRMRNEQEMTLDEIAEATGHPKSSIKATISSARREMLEQLKNMSK